MYKVTLCKYIWNGDCSESSTQWVLLSQPLELPFAPMPGLTINLPMQRGWVLRSSAWVVESQTFTCYAEDQYMDGIDDYFEDWIESLTDQDSGWTLAAGPHPKN